MLTRLRALLCAAAFAACVSVCSQAASRDLKVATWNLDWLTFRHAGDPELPSDVGGRDPADFEVLAAYAARLDADVVAIEEVDGPAPAARLFPPDRYQVEMTGDGVTQRVGLAVRRGIDVERHPDLGALDVEPRARHRLRSGLDATLVFPGGIAVRVLAIHLKSGCWSEDEDREARPACDLLSRQVPVLADWIAARRREGVAFLVLGDFNRRLVQGDRVLAALDEAAPLASATAGASSPCWDGEDFIDHILAGDAAASWMEPGTLRVLTYRGMDPSRKDHVSDHCPVSVHFALPDAIPAATGTAGRR
jgi:endonuclease/exonuclease/phosphatase family metal-dependent hydrolase